MAGTEGGRPADSQSLNHSHGHGHGHAQSQAGSTTTSHNPSHGKHSLAHSYRRQSFTFAAGSARPSLLSTSPAPPMRRGWARANLTDDEVKSLEQEERELLKTSLENENRHRDRDRSRDRDRRRRDSRAGYGAVQEHETQATDSQAVAAAGRQTHHGSATTGGGGDESTPLLSGAAAATSEDLCEAWDEAVQEDKATSTFSHEAAVLGRSSVPLVVTFLLQASEQFSTVFVLGHLGTKELGASSLSTMLSAIMAFSLFQGCISSLDTLCPQAYGAGKKELVGIHVQRCLLLLGLLHIPVGFVFLNGENVMLLLKQDPEIARLVGAYLRRFLLGVPAMGIFETLKRYTQAKGDFRAGTVCLFVSAPLNVLLNYLLVYNARIGIGFIGAPTAVAITFWLQAFLLFTYIWLVDDKDAWSGFSRRAFSNWGPMIRLAIPGVVMILSEWAAFEVLSVFSSWLGTSQLAAQSILNTSSSILFQVPFAVSVATATRIGNLIGAGTEQPARICSRVAMWFGLTIALVGAALLFSLRHRLGRLFSTDEEVVRLVSAVVPFLAFFSCFDALAAVAQGVLRGLGKQAVAAIVNLPAYYIVALPAGILLAFPAKLGLYGIWIGMFLALLIVAVAETAIVFFTDFRKVIRKARERNERDEAASLDADAQD